MGRKPKGGSFTPAETPGESRNDETSGQAEGDFERQGPKQHKLVERVLGDPAEFPARAFRLHGFLGKESEVGFWRIYLSTQLDHYVRVAEADIVTVRDASSAALNEQLDEVWVRQDANLTETRALPKQILNSFLRGSLVDRLPVAAYEDPTPRRAQLPRRRSNFRRAAEPADLAPNRPLSFGDVCEQGPTSYETGCNIEGPLTSTCGTYPFFGCNPTGPNCVDTFGSSCHSANPNCNSRPSICLCDS